MVKIFIDPGHGGNDPGAVGNGLREKDLTLQISKRIEAILKNEYEGVQVKMSRTSDQTVSLPQRTSAANAWGADFLLSVHINAGGGNGYEDFIYNGNVGSGTVASQNVMHDEIIKQVDFKDRGKKRKNLHMLRESRMPALLTENGFIDNASDARKLKDFAYIDKIVRGHVNGLVKVFGLKRIGQQATTIDKIPVKPAPSSPKQTTWTGQILRKGDSGPLVKSLQEMLISKGFSLPRYGADGQFGDETENAVRAAQRATGITVDGVPGPQTYHALINYNPKKFKFKHWNGSVIRKGEKGRHVKELQERLIALGYKLPHYGADSVFGDETSNAVRQFQRDAGIKVDGIPGPETKRALEKPISHEVKN